MKYLVTEIQTFETGAVSNPTYAYDDRLTAESKYHALLSGAAISKLPTHAVVLMTLDGRLISSQSYTHPVETPEPEPTPEIEPEEEPEVTPEEETPAE